MAATKVDWVLVSGVSAGAAGLLAHLADVFTCYNSRDVLDDVLMVPGDILDMENSALMMAEKTLTELALGHVFALIFIPAGVVGAYFLFHVIRKEFDYLRWPFVAVLFVLYTLGGLMHCSFTFLGLLARTKEFSGSDLAETVRPFFEVICQLVGERLMLPGNLAVFGLLLSQCTVLPRWTCLVCPGALQLYVALLARYAPLGLRVYLLVTIYNMSSGIWWLVMSWAYWRGQTDNDNDAAADDAGRATMTRSTATKAGSVRRPEEGPGPVLLGRSLSKEDHATANAGKKKA